MKNIKVSEIKAFLYRLILVFVFYTISRILFIINNSSILEIDTISEWINICFYGLKFDAAGIAYTNIPFILLSLIPLWINQKGGYQKVLTFLYFLANIPALALNFIDIAYYPFNHSRTTLASYEVLENESNISSLFSHFAVDYWYLLVIFFLMVYLWVKIYSKIKIETKAHKPLPYFGKSILYLVLGLISILYVIRGDLAFSTRPITLVDANRYVQNPSQSIAILNTPFAFIRTINKKSIKKINYYTDEEVEEIIPSVKYYPKDSNDLSKPNIVLFIVESFSREFIGAFNKEKNLPNYVSYTPFIDSLSEHSLIFPNSYANGMKSIHAMASIIAGIPSFKDAFSSSPYVNQDIESIVSISKKMGYSSHFFHGAANGSMGFNGLANILGYDHYYGKTEYNNDEDYDGIWGIWDEPFFQFKKEVLDTVQQPFLSTIFTLSSHDPYKLPEKYKGIIPEGKIPLHKCITYTDNAIRQFMAKARKEPWFKNTVFVFTADHTNQVYQEEEYYKILNRFSVPIIFYSPNSDILQGKSFDRAQHIDIYPTLVDLMGYDKPFRSWGRSLLKEENDYFMGYKDGWYYYADSVGNCAFDGENTFRFYQPQDLGLRNKLPGKNDYLAKKCKSFIQSYNNKIVGKKLK